MVYHIKTPAFPDMHFEWHEEKKIVYLINLSDPAPTGNAIALNVENHGTAINMVLVYLRGYRAGQAQTITIGG